MHQRNGPASIDDTGEPVNYSPYSTGRLGVDLSVSWPGSNIRSYVESGLLLILPNADFVELFHRGNRSWDGCNRRQDLR
jgi:hypothetical protein